MGASQGRMTRDRHSEPHEQFFIESRSDDTDDSDDSSDSSSSESSDSDSDYQPSRRRSRGLGLSRRTESHVRESYYRQTYRREVRQGNSYHRESHQSESYHRESRQGNSYHRESHQRQAYQRESVHSSSHRHAPLDDGVFRPILGDYVPRPSHHSRHLARQNCLPGILDVPLLTYQQGQEDFPKCGAGIPSQLAIEPSSNNNIIRAPKQQTLRPRSTATRVQESTQQIMQSSSNNRGVQVTEYSAQTTGRSVTLPAASTPAPVPEVVTCSPLVSVEIWGPSPRVVELPATPNSSTLTLPALPAPTVPPVSVTEKPEVKPPQDTIAATPVKAIEGAQAADAKSSNEATQVETRTSAEAAKMLTSKDADQIRYGFITYAGHSVVNHWRGPSKTRQLRKHDVLLSLSSGEHIIVDSEEWASLKRKGDRRLGAAIRQGLLDRDTNYDLKTIEGLGRSGRYSDIGSCRSSARGSSISRGSSYTSAAGSDDASEASHMRRLRERRRRRHVAFTDDESDVSFDSRDDPDNISSIESVMGSSEMSYESDRSDSTIRAAPTRRRRATRRSSVASSDAGSERSILESIESDNESSASASMETHARSADDTNDESSASGSMETHAASADTSNESSDSMKTHAQSQGSTDESSVPAREKTYVESEEASSGSKDAENEGAAPKNPAQGQTGRNKKKGKGKRK